MIGNASASLLTALVLPTLASAVSWAMVIWALKQDGPLTEVIRRLISGSAETSPGDQGRNLNQRNKEGVKS